MTGPLWQRSSASQGAGDFDDIVDDDDIAFDVSALIVSGTPHRS